jgi:hypothetical protein
VYQEGRFRLLDAAEPEACAQWLAMWHAWPGREVFAHPGYAGLFSPRPDHVLCAAWNSPVGGVLFPLILRPIDGEEWIDTPSGLADVTSPYGYGGPFCWGDVDAAAFWSEFRRWASRRGVVSCFARLSVFENGLLGPTGCEHVNAPNVVRGLDLAPDALWMDYEHKVRKNVKRARREGLHVEIDASGSRLDDFLAIYHGTMDRRGASSSYYFDRNFFLTLVRDLEGQFVFFHAFHDAAVVSSELVLVSAYHLYSFLGGTRADAFALRPNDLLKHEIILWGQRAGKQAFVLGGGYGGPDGIFRHKLSFAPGGEVPFRTSQMVLDPAAYDRLTATRAAWEARQGREWNARPGFFPAYRA